MFFVDEFGVVWQGCAQWARGAEHHPVFGTSARRVDRQDAFQERPAPAGEVRAVAAPTGAVHGCYY